MLYDVLCLHHSKPVHPGTSSWQSSIADHLLNAAFLPYPCHLPISSRSWTLARSRCISYHQLNFSSTTSFNCPDISPQDDLSLEHTCTRLFICDTPRVALRKVIPALPGKDEKSDRVPLAPVKGLTRAVPSEVFSRPLGLHQASPCIPLCGITPSLGRIINDDGSYSVDKE